MATGTCGSPPIRPSRASTRRCSAASAFPRHTSPPPPDRSRSSPDYEGTDVMGVFGFERRALLQRVLTAGGAVAASWERVVGARSLQQRPTGLVRRVVVGHNAAGRSCVLSDGA